MDLHVAEICPSDNRPKWWANSKSWEAFHTPRGPEQETNTQGKGKSKDSESKTKAIPSRGSRRNGAKAEVEAKASASGKRGSLSAAGPDTRGRKRKAVSDDKSAMPSSKHSVRFEDGPVGVRKPIDRRTPEMDSLEEGLDTVTPITATPQGAQGTSPAPVSSVVVLYLELF
jgi:hypothetical protein